METARYKAFLSSVENGSFSKAAIELGYTPSGVSQLVNALENEFGFSLLLRNKRGVSLTPNGEKMLPAIHEFLLQESRINQIAAEINGLAIGDITIAAYSSVATHWLPAIIKLFQERYPQIQIKLMEGIRQEVTKWIDNKQADIGFLSYQEPMSYDWIPLAEDKMVAVLPESHPLAEAISYPLDRCADERFIMPALGRDDDVVDMLERNHITPNIAFTTLENFATLAMIEKGLGMSIMNELITRNWQCDVAMIPIEPSQQITLGIALPSLKDAAPAVKRFVEFAVMHLTQREA